MKSYLLLIVPTLFISIVSCTKDAQESTGISDVSLSSMTNSSDLTLARTTHTDEGDLLIKMNSIASKASTNDINSYPVNSMIVKEKLDANGKVLRYSVMYKAPADKNSNDGWLWSEYDAEKHVIYSNSERGMSCQSCHASLGRNMQ
jgi:hypothetical protein